MAPIDFKNLQWEDEENIPLAKAKKAESADFAAMLADEKVENEVFQRGSQVSGTVMSISDTSNDVIVEVTAQTTGVLDKNEFIGEDGQLTIQPGDQVRVYVVAHTDAELQLSTRLSQSKQGVDDLYTAMRAQLPVKGKVVKENSGGFDVMVLGKRAFCPVSQMDRSFVQNKSEYINKDFNFLIEKIESGGRNIVVSRAKLLAKEAELRVEALLNDLSKDTFLEGTVKDVRDYGAFVDIGGVDGFVHISEMSFSRINKAFEFVSRGEKVKVKVLSVERHNGKPRISLSMKAAANDPWTDITDRYRDGQSYPGLVKRLETFGAFIELEPGVEGLAHISELSWTKRIMHPSEVLKAGDAVQVRILNIDSAKRKISLSVKDMEQDPWQDAAQKFPVGQEVTGKIVSLKGFGAIVELAPGISGMVPMTALKNAYGDSYRKKCSPPQERAFRIHEVNTKEKKIVLTPPEMTQTDDIDSDYREYVKQQKEQSAASSAPTSKAQGTFGALLAAKLNSKP